MSSSESFYFLNLIINSIGIYTNCNIYFGLCLKCKKIRLIQRVTFNDNWKCSCCSANNKNIITLEEMSIIGHEKIRRIFKEKIMHKDKLKVYRNDLYKLINYLTFFDEKPAAQRLI